MDNLNSEIVLAFPTVVPPIAEQNVIVASLAAMGASITDTRAKLEAQMSLSLEHRQALVTTAVTGQLPIPGLAA